MRKKLMMILGLATSLALAAAVATEIAKGSDKTQASVSADKEVQKTTIVAESGHPCRKAGSTCLKKSSTASAAPMGDQNVASSGFDCPKSADCPKTADCDKSNCLKQKGGKAKAEPSKSGEAIGTGTEI